MSGQNTEKKFKVHNFTTSTKWTGGRTWDISGMTTEPIAGGPPPVFRGIEGKWTPEDMLLSSVNTCTLSTFTGYCERKHFEFVSYECEAEGTLEHDGTNYKFSKIILRPKIGVKSEEDIETAREYIDRAHDLCFMGYSVKADIIIEPEIFVADQGS